MFVRLDKRLADRHHYMLSYTLAKETDQGPTGTITDFYVPEWTVGRAAVTGVTASWQAAQ